MSKPKLLIFVEYYLPGYKWGGPVQSVSNLVLLLKRDYDIFVVTRDRDFLDTKPYPGIVQDEWLDRDGYQVIYLSPARLTLRSVYRLVRSESFDFVYTNSLFGQFSHGLLLMAWLAGQRLVVAPRGELNPGALRLKSYKKYPFMQLVKGIPTGRITWHATDQNELQAIKRNFPESQVGVVPVVLAPDTPKQLEQRQTYQKQTGRARLVFIGRITPVKGLAFLADLLACVTDWPIELDIYGPVDAPGYWQACQQVFAKTTPNCCVTYKGILEHNRVNATLASYDFFILPTFGENFGHAIFEAFSVGLPVIISDQTQWRQLAHRQAGWDTPLQKNQWLTVLKTAVAIDSTAYATMSKAARAVAEQYMSSEQFDEKYRLLFS